MDLALYNLKWLICQQNKPKSNPENARAWSKGLSKLYQKLKSTTRGTKSENKR